MTYQIHVSVRIYTGIIKRGDVIVEIYLYFLFLI